MCLTVVHAQTVNDKPLREIDAEYLEIFAKSKSFSSVINIHVDFGQKTKFFTLDKQTILKDENGEALEFNSMIDALNFMSKHGFEYLDMYVNTVGKESINHYLLKNKKQKQQQQR